MSSSGGGAVESEGEGSGGQGLKKGPWTAAEDLILVEYVKKHGEGNWNAVQKNSGLMRCGKSCRLRWANHLRPNLKKGAFTPDEESIIIELHAKLGNRWARMAAQLPGRTDNEIKNYWNTRMKRRQRAGLPLYPQEVQDEAAAFHLQQQQQQQQQQDLRQHHKRPSSSSSSSSLSSILSSSHPRKRSNYFHPSFSSLLDPTSNFSANTNPLQSHQLTTSSLIKNYTHDPIHHQFKLYSDSNNSKNSVNNGGNANAFALPLSSPVSTLYNQNYPVHDQSISTTPSLIQFSNSAGNFETNNNNNSMSYSSLLMGSAQIEPLSFLSGLKAELPSFQTPLQQPTTPASSITSGTNCMMDNSNNGNSGLLDALLQESKALSRNNGKSKLDAFAEEEEEEDDGKSVIKIKGEASVENQWEDLSSYRSSIGIKPSNEEPIGQMNSMDDDLLSLLNNFPSSMPLPDWYLGSSNLSNGSSSSSSSGVTGRNTKLEAQKNGSQTPDDPSMAAAQDQLDWTLGSCYWNNMPRIF